MRNVVEKETQKLAAQETRLLCHKARENQIKAKLYDKVPDRLRKTLEGAFEKAFEVVFVNGTGVIEKTFCKEDLTLDFEAADYVLQRKATRKNMKRVDQSARKSNAINSVLTTAAGAGLGALGAGLPDIPLLVGTMLKGLYQIALSYGISYESEEEKIYILRLIRLALCAEELRAEYNRELDSREYGGVRLADEITETARVLSEAVLVEKFVQGIPLIGAVGAITNHLVYRKISVLAVLKYKQRYLHTQKLK
ncbi:MAG: EcsC family protein [Pygmaiobacter sp.]